MRQSLVLWGCLCPALLMTISACGGSGAGDNPTPQAQCGNAELETGEACDDGNTDNTDGCTNSCEVATCGDGVTRSDLSVGDDGFEACDDGNAIDTDACTTACVIAVCGDGLVRSDLGESDLGFERCDDGNQVDTDACRNTCVPASCGDGVKRADLAVGADGFEACDDGNTDDLDACTNACLVAACGDGLVRTDLREGDEGYEACDDGNDVDTDACTAGCGVAICGDGITRADIAEGADGYEGCDDGNDVDTDACRTSCIAATCGDGVLRTDLSAEDMGFEACDDGNDSSTDACVEGCAVAACGDGFVFDGQEACDDGNDVDSDACLATCVVATCGDSIVRTDIADPEAEGYESCDDGNDVNTDDCLNNCITARCGDGVVQEEVEACDDGNQVNTDACSNTCQTRCAEHSDCSNGQLCDSTLGQFGDCVMPVGSQCQTDDDCVWVDRNRETQSRDCVDGTCRLTQLSVCTNNNQCGRDSQCVVLGNQRLCAQSCTDGDDCRYDFMGCYSDQQRNQQVCYYNICGQANEVAQAFAGAAGNGNLHRGCGPVPYGGQQDPTGSCQELPNNGNHVGLCFAGGGVAQGAVCDPDAERGTEEAYCQPGLACVSADAQNSRCRQLCSLQGAHGTPRSCPRGEVCMHGGSWGATGVCVPQSQQCRIGDRALCPENMRCFIHQMESDSGSCGQTSELVARDGACTQDNNCPDGQYCYDGTRCRSYCTQACQQGERCFKVENTDEVGYCIPNPPPPPPAP